MGRDNHPRERQAQRLARKRARREPLARILIVCEGTKTEPFYFEEIRQSCRLATANVQVRYSEDGTCPKKIVDFARKLFQEGDIHRQISPRTFERVYAVFDRDEHRYYHDALRYADSLDRKLRNDEGKLVQFKAIASVPNFELWLLLHFQKIWHPIERGEVIHRLKQCLPNY